MSWEMWDRRFEVLGMLIALTFGGWDIDTGAKWPEEYSGNTNVVNTKCLTSLEV